MPDKHGHPTEKELEYIRNYDTTKLDWEELMYIIQKRCWHWGEQYFYKEDNKWIAITGGWSGNEVIIHAMKDNIIFWMMYWESSRRGGYHIFSKRRRNDV